MGGVLRNRLVASTCLIGMAAIVPVTAQDVGTDNQRDVQRQGTWVTLNVESGFEVDDNLELNVNSRGVSTLLTNDIAFEIGKSTQRDRLVFGLTGDLRYEARAQDDNELILLAPRATLSYSRTGLNSSFRVNGGLQRRNLSRSFEFTADTDGDGLDDIFDLRTGSGFLNSSNIGAQYVYGLNAPIKLTFSANVSDRSYDVTDADLFEDSETVNLGVDAEFRFSPVTTGLASVSVNKFESEDAFDTLEIDNIDRTTNRASIGVRHEFSDIWTFEVDAGLAKITTLTGPDQIEDVENGTDLNFNATRRLSYGSAFGELTRLTRVSGERTTLRFGGAYDLPDGGLTASIGRTQLAGGDGNWVFAAGYQKELVDGQLSANIERSIRTSNDGDQDDLVVTELSLAYLKRINNTQTLTIGLERNNLEDNPRSVVQSELTAVYSFDLTRDWDLNVGYTHRRTNISAGRTASSNAVSLTVSREFDLF